MAEASLAKFAEPEAATHDNPSRGFGIRIRRNVLGHQKGARTKPLGPPGSVLKRTDEIAVDSGEQVRPTKRIQQAARRIADDRLGISNTLGPKQLPKILQRVGLLQDEGIGLTGFQFSQRASNIGRKGRIHGPRPLYILSALRSEERRVGKECRSR